MNVYVYTCAGHLFFTGIYRWCFPIFSGAFLPCVLEVLQAQVGCLCFVVRLIRHVSTRHQMIPWAVTCTKQCSFWWESLMVTDIILKVKVTWLIARNMLFHGARITPVGSKGYCENCRTSNSIKLSRWDYLNWIGRFGVYGFRSTLDFIHTLSILSTLVLPYPPPEIRV